MLPQTSILHNKRRVLCSLGIDHGLNIANLSIFYLSVMVVKHVF